MRYIPGTVIQGKNGRAYVKGKDGKWTPRARVVFALKKGELEEGQRVFHIDGDRFNDEEENLVAIQFGVRRYNLLHSRVIHIPKTEKSAKRAVLVR